MTWTEQINQGLAAFGVQLPASVPLDEWAMKLADDPCRNTAALVALSSLLFYAAEKEHNPKVNDVFDAAVYCSTCLSVGYGDIFARTPIGKLLGTVLMTIGPALSGAVLDGPAEQRGDPTQEQILTTLKQILERLPQNGDEADDVMGTRPFQ